MNRTSGAQRASRTGLVFYRTVTVNLRDVFFRVYVRACPPDSAELRAVSIAHESNPSEHHLNHRSVSRSAITVIPGSAGAPADTRRSPPTQQLYRTKRATHRYGRRAVSIPTQPPPPASTRLPRDREGAGQE